MNPNEAAVRRYVVVGGRRHLAVLYREDGQVWMQLAGRGPQRAAGRGEYAYTHGGEVYRAACEAAWVEYPGDFQ